MTCHGIPGVPWLCRLASGHDHGWLTLPPGLSFLIFKKEVIKSVLEGCKAPLFDRYLNTYYVPDAILWVGNVAVMKRDKTPCLHGAYTQEGKGREEKDTKQDKLIKYIVQYSEKE